MRERRDTFLAALRQGQIPQANLELEENYRASETIAAYGAHPDPNVLPATISPYWFPSGPTSRGAFIAQMQNPPRIPIPDNTPLPPGAEAWGLYPPPPGKMRVKIPGTEQIVEVSTDQAAVCACIEWTMWRFLEMLPAVLQSTPQQSKPPAHLAEPFSSGRGDTCTDSASPVLVFGSGFSEVIRRTPPQNHLGVVSSLYVELDNPAAFNDVEWRLLVNGVPVRGFNQYRQRPGSPSAPLRLNVTIPENGAMSVEAQARTLNAVYRATASLNGYDYPVLNREQGIRGTLADVVL